MFSFFGAYFRSFSGHFFIQGLSWKNREFANKTLRGESTEEGRAEDEEERLDRASLRGD